MRHAGVVVRFRDNPCRRIRHSLRAARRQLNSSGKIAVTTATYQVQHLALHYKGVKAIHDFFDGRCVVPPVDVENVDVAGA